MPTVKTTNSSGQTAEVVVDDEMAETLRAKARREASGLESVEIVADGPDADLVEVPVEYRPRPAVTGGVATDETPEPVVLIDQRKSAPGQVVPDSDPDDDPDIDALRVEYEDVYGSAPDGRWKADTLRRRIAEKQG